ncbi:sentrin-specific protease 6-like isoform X2 [Saccostrea echinata]|uniref:sentrin-specific protease 6-like isoform X2 n=1 Tax=Saccostrea echinata TaxID=191078 RepID=UPI002A83446A|nr:sentrin-specific protease 6-like isoform X2 [Saccostrea echinata]
MSLISGLEEKEKSSDQGWSDSCRFPTSDSVVEVDSQTSDSVQQTIVEPIETVVINSSLEESVEIDSQEGGLGLNSSAQESGSQVVDSQTNEKGTESDKFEGAKFQQKPQSQEEGEVQIVENGSEAVQNNAAVQEQQKLKLQPSFNAKGQIELTLTGTCNKPEEKALLEKLLSKVNYQQLANQVNLSSAHPGAARQTVQVNLATSAQPSATQQTVQATRSPQVPLVRTTIGPSTPLAQFNSQLGTSSSQTRSPLNINAILNCANQGKISKEDLLKLIKSCRTATGLNTQPQSPQQLQGQKIIQVQSVPTAAGNQVINPVLLAAPVQKIGTVSLAKQTTLANLIQSKSNQGVGSGGVTTSSNVGSPQLSTDNTPPKVVHIAASTPVKQATTVNNNQVNSNLTLTSPQKVQTVGSLQTVTSKNQTVIIPSGATQYIIVNPGTPIQKVNHQAVGNQQASAAVNSGVKLAGAQLTTPVRIIHSASPQLSQVQTPLASPSFSASQSPTKIVIPQNFSVLTSVVDNANIPSTQGVAISVPPGTNVNSQTLGRGIANRRGPQVRQPRPQGRGKRTIKQNYFVNPASAQAGSATSPVQIRPQNCNDAIKAVPLSQPVIVARTQSSGQLVQSNIIKQQVNHTGISMNKLEGASPGQSNSSSLVNYSDSDSPSNSSDKGESESSSELSKSQTSGVRTLSNGALVMPDILSEAIARAKPTDKILVNFTNSKGAVKFQKNTVYKIPCKGENKFYRYDGQYLVPANETTFGLIGGGVGNRKEKPLRGNATGLHMTTPQQGNSARSFLNAAEAVGKVFKEGRFWKHTAGPQRTIFRLANNTDQDTDEETSELTSQDNKQGKKRPIEDVSDLPPINDDEMRVVHCKFCGYTSMTVKSCERCCRTFPADTKIEIQKKKLKTDVENKEEDTAISKQTFYGKTVTNQVVLHPATNRDGNIVYVNYVTKGRRVNLEGKTYRSPSVIRGAKQPKKIHTLEPVTISISSDEEEETEKSGIPESPATGSEPQATVEKDDIGQLLDNIPQSKRTASPVFQNSRMKRMENEEGIPIIRKTGKRKSPTMPPSQGTATNVPPNELADPQRSEEAMDVSIVDFHARVIHIGSVLGCPVEPVFIAEDSISFQVECEDNTHKFIIKPDELQQCMYCLENRPVIFLKTTPEFARKVREMLKLETVNGENGFDPNDHVMKHQFITILLVSLGSLTSQKLECVLRKYPQPKDTTFNFIQQMTANEAALYLKEIQGDESMSEPSTPQPQPHERSPSPPKILFTGPVVKLITFPPPPAPGGIQVTNEDLSCLQEGEFLNDVIIDFYLKYLFLNVLSDKDRERTHMFSSFFFKRLTQRQGRCGPEDSMADKTPAEKKHARVKNWTKKVDLFEKDFIFVPINEHSHWFLAVICFPGLPSAKRITYVPKSASTETQPVTGPEVSPQDLNSKEEGGMGKEPVKSEAGGLEKEPVKSLKGYRIPKVVKNGEPSSESGDGSVKCLPSEENSRESGKSALESMETDENSLSEGQKKEIAEDSEEMMDTSESPTQSEIEQSQTDTEKSKDQSDSSSQDTGKSESESKTETNNQVKAKASKPVFKATVRDLRGRELTEEELKDPSSLKTFTTGCRQPCILIFDSLAGQSRSRIVAILKEYLQVEWDTKKKTPNSLRERIRGCTATKVPQQTNFSDCGVYILQYVESFFEDPIQDFSIPLKSLSDWFTEERVTAKRSEIRELVMSLKESQEKGKS